MPEVKKILCAVDFSAASLEAYAYAKDIACLKKAYLYVLHVYYLDPNSLQAGVDERNYALTEVRLEQLIEESPEKDQIKIQSIMEKGNVARTIVRCAKELQADFLVMGSRGKSGLDKLILGSNAEYALEHCKTPILIIRK
jgi:nucleotide-binding universal stress UspA family protein